MSDARAPKSGDVTLLLSQMRSGEPSAAEELFPLVYNELRKLAAAYIRLERPDHTLQATALVHEAFIKMAGREEPSIIDRAHFFSVAAQAMRYVLVDHARGRKSAKRKGSINKVPLHDSLMFACEHPEQLLAVHLALGKLEKLSMRQARVVEMRYFAGLSVREVALALNITPRTVSRDWSVAQAWLKRELNP